MAKYDENTIDRIMDMYLKEEKSGQAIAKELGIPRSTVYFYIQRNTGYDSLDFTKRNFRFLINRSKHLESVVSVLQESRCSANDPLKLKLKELERLSDGEYNVHVLCEALKVPRGTYYNHMLRGKGDDVWYKRRRVELKEAIAQVFNESQQRYGAPKITAVLRDRGIRTTPELVKELMIEMGLSCVRQEAKALYKKTQIHNHNLVQRRFNPKAPNEIWVSDVTTLKINDHYYYVCVVLDLFSRRIIGYSIGYRNSTALIKKAFLSAYNDRRPKEELIFHSDRGSNYRSKAFGICLDNHNVVQSYSKPHTPTDNAVAEAFFKTLKQEELYRRVYRSEREFKKSIVEYMRFYNEDRPHKTLHYKTPVQFEAEYYNGGKPVKDNC